MAFGGNNTSGPIDVATALLAQPGSGWKGDFDSETFVTMGAVAGPLNSAVRRLTPKECERLQGFPDGYTAIPWKKKAAEECPDGPRYKALGNSMAVPVMRWIGHRVACELAKRVVS